MTRDGIPRRRTRPAEWWLGADGDDDLAPHLGVKDARAKSSVLDQGVGDVASTTQLVYELIDPSKTLAARVASATPNNTFTSANRS
jgi:hypothetical protein